MLQQRGIHGVLLTFQPHHRTQIPLEFSRYCVIGLSRSLDWAGVDFVSPDHFMGCTQAWIELVRRGYKRIGYVTHNRMMSAYLGKQVEVDLPLKDRIPVHSVDYSDGNDRNQFFAWLQRYEPDAIITHEPWCKM